MGGTPMPRKLAGRVGIAPTLAGFGVPCIACLPPTFVAGRVSESENGKLGWRLTFHSPNRLLSLLKIRGARALLLHWRTRASSLRSLMIADWEAA